MGGHRSETGGSGHTSVLPSAAERSTLAHAELEGMGGKQGTKNLTASDVPGGEDVHDHPLSI